MVNIMGILQVFGIARTIVELGKGRRESSLLENKSYDYFMNL